MPDEQQLLSPSKRKKKQADELSNAESDTTPSTTSEEDTETDTTATTVDDGLPHPRVGAHCKSAEGSMLTINSPLNPDVNSLLGRLTSGRRPS
jgi:hypothetical protein